MKNSFRRHVLYRLIITLYQVFKSWKLLFTPLLRELQQGKALDIICNDKLMSSWHSNNLNGCITWHCVNNRIKFEVIFCFHLLKFPNSGYISKDIYISQLIVSNVRPHWLFQTMPFQCKQILNSKNLDRIIYKACHP